MQDKFQRVQLIQPRSRANATDLSSSKSVLQWDMPCFTVRLLLWQWDLSTKPISRAHYSQTQKSERNIAEYAVVFSSRYNYKGIQQNFFWTMSFIKPLIEAFFCQTSALRFRYFTVRFGYMTVRPWDWTKNSESHCETVKLERSDATGGVYDSDSDIEG